MELAEDSWGTFPEALQALPMACGLAATLNPMDMDPLTLCSLRHQEGPSLFQETPAKALNSQQ